MAVINHNDSGAAQVTDYANYWTASPLLDANNNPTIPAPLPVVDSQQDWTMTCSAVVSGEYSYRIVRAFNTGDIHEDRMIVSGSMHVIFAYAADLQSNVLAYHTQTNRGNTQVTFTGASTVYTVPSDADDFIDLAFSGFSVQPLQTQYACQAFDVSTLPRQIVAFEPLSNSSVSGYQFMHHM